MFRQRTIPLFFALDRAILKGLLLVSAVIASLSPLLASENDIWLIDSHHAQRCADKSLSQESLHVFKLSEANNWTPSSPNEFLASQNPEVATVFLFHGNWTTVNQAVQEGMSFHRQLKQVEKDPVEGNVVKSSSCRLVIWAWPSERILPCARKDIRLKAAWSDTQGGYVADLVSQFPPKSRVTFVGFSFGARIAMAATELLAGGTVEGFQIAPSRLTGLEPTLNAVLLAPAFDQFWLSPNQRFGQALDLINKIQVNYNSQDGSLRFYPLLYGLGGPKAIGATGIPLNTISTSNRPKITSTDMRRIVGKEHSIFQYIGTSLLQKQMAAILE